MTIAVTGATGQLGRLVIAGLLRQVPADRLVALARDPAKGADLGVAVRLADYARPATLAPALQGVRTLLLVSSSEVGQRAAQHENVIAAASTAGVERIVYTSLLRADTSPLSLAIEHRATETALRRSGLAFTILRNGWYLENHTQTIGGAIAAGGFIGSAGTGRFSSAARADYAAAAVAVLTGADHAGKIYELAGDESFTMSDLAALVSARTGKTLGYTDLPEADYAAALIGFGLPEPLARAIADADTGAAAGALHDDGKQLSRLIGRPTTSLATAIDAALG